ncbi:ATP-binding cassette domain-containing protein [Kineosporia sp. A_224]|uniref:ATP-binding cassette domain-containing protein n=1 Tax=Kineosporia sp. A_224 TaxID=1962180 RepID=UPI000B4B7F41|nr:ATP-binding cassette domain-containing protein [Kineosporia sp. A_224]
MLPPHDPAAAGGAAILAQGLGRSYGPVLGVRDIDLHVDTGAVVGLLGPNGSGKTTLIRMLATLLRPSAGQARVGGADLRTQPGEVRRHIGLTGQYAAVDQFLTGRENIRMTARMLGMSRADAGRRAEDLLGSFDLRDAADRPLSTYSGGMRRRLDLALSLTGRPSIVFLDEPTTGLDPRSRFAMWTVIEGLVADGTTVLLSTQYLEEADRLAERVVILDHGLVVAEGPPDALRAQVGAHVVDLTLTDPADGRAALDALAGLASAPVEHSPGSRELRVPVAGSEALPDVVRLLDAAGVRFRGLAVHEPSLDDVFLALTGRPAPPPSGMTAPEKDPTMPPMVTT